MKIYICSIASRLFWYLGQLKWAFFDEELLENVDNSERLDVYLLQWQNAQWLTKNKTVSMPFIREI